MKRDLRLIETYPYPPERVWRALTDPTAMADWLMPNDFEPKIGHRFQFRTKPAPGFDGIVHCEVLELEPPRTLAFSWRGGGVETVVRFTLERVAGGTCLHFEQTGFQGAKGVMVSFILGSGWKKKILPHNLPAAAGRIGADGSYTSLSMAGLEKDCA